MKKSMKIFTVAAAALVLGGVLLGAAQGTQTDPLVTMSYLTAVTTPKILKDVDLKLDSREAALVAKLDSAIDQFAKDMDKLLVKASGGQTALSTAAFTTVTVESGKQLVGGVGTEVILRTGTATCVSSAAPGLLDSTAGSNLASGGALAENHLYLAIGQGQGLQATTKCTVMVRGAYTIQ